MQRAGSSTGRRLFLDTSVFKFTEFLLVHPGFPEDRRKQNSTLAVRFGWLCVVIVLRPGLNLIVYTGIEIKSNRA
jgi:hypothetical protein